MGRRAHARVGGGVGYTAGISGSKSPPWLPLLHVLRILRKQLYIAERVVGSIPIMDETTEGAALVVHVVLYICFVSVAIDTLNAWTRGLLHNTPTLQLQLLGARRLGCAP